MAISLHAILFVWLLGTVFFCLLLYAIGENEPEGLDVK